MDPTSRTAAPSDLSDPAADAGSGESRAAPAKAALDVGSGSGLLPYLPIPRHRRPSNAQLTAGETLASARFIRFTIVFTILFVLAMTALIWYRWYPVDLPLSSIMFVGDDSLDGAVVTVTRKGQESYSVTLDKQNDYIATVWLSAPGKYDLVVRQKNQAVVQRATIDISPRQNALDTLSAKPGGPAPATAPATQPATSSS